MFGLMLCMCVCLLAYQKFGRFFKPTIGMMIEQISIYIPVYVHCKQKAQVLSNSKQDWKMLRRGRSSVKSNPWPRQLYHVHFFPCVLLMMTLSPLTLVGWHAIFG